MYTERHVILATDELSLLESLKLAEQAGGRIHAIKVHNHYDQCGPELVKRFHDVTNAGIFVDYKLHDIPNTVRLRAKELGQAGATILTVHCAGDVEMMVAAREGAPNTEIFGITILTSLSEEQTHTNYGGPTKAKVLQFARMAKLAGITGVVCSPQEVGVLTKRPELKGLKFITPGIRSVGKDANDQQRVATPAAAIKAGADYLVIGRQITQALYPADALMQIEDELAEALGTSAAAKA